RPLPAPPSRIHPHSAIAIPRTSSRSVAVTWPLATAHPAGRHANYFAVSQGTLSLVIKCLAGFLIANLSLACGVAGFNAYLTTAMLGVAGQMDTSSAQFT